MKSVPYLEVSESEKIKNVLLKPDGVIAFPTDTVFGLGCLIQNFQAVEKIYSTKNRDTTKPLILLGYSLEALNKYVSGIPSNVLSLIKSNWPGPLTVILPKSRYVPDYITSNKPTVGIRVPDHKILLELLKHCTQDGVLATTSANISEQDELNSKEAILEVLGDNVDYIIDNNEISLSGCPSTIITVDNQGEIVVLRQGTLIIE